MENQGPNNNEYRNPFEPDNGENGNNNNNNDNGNKKNRNGQTGTVRFRFLPKCSKFIPVE